MQDKLTDGQRLESVVKWANMTTNYFARYIGLSRGENLYQILRGNNGISQKTASLIREKFPEINTVWLLTGDGEMLQGSDHAKASKPMYNLGVEQSIRDIDSLEASEQLLLPSNIDFDLGMLYLGRAMGERTPTNSVVLLKKILPEMIIPGDECVIVTKNIVLLRIAKVDDTLTDSPRIRLVAIDHEFFGDVVVEKGDIEAAYVVKGKILTNI